MKPASLAFGIGSPVTCERDSVCLFESPSNYAQYQVVPKTDWVCVVEQRNEGFVWWHVTPRKHLNEAHATRLTGWLREACLEPNADRIDIIEAFSDPDP